MAEHDLVGTVRLGIHTATWRGACPVPGCNTRASFTIRPREAWVDLAAAVAKAHAESAGGGQDG